jgi:hypothetical protein
VETFWKSLFKFRFSQNNENNFSSTASLSASRGKRTSSPRAPLVIPKIKTASVAVKTEIKNDRQHEEDQREIDDDDDDDEEQQENILQNTKTAKTENFESLPTNQQDIFGAEQIRQHEDDDYGYVAKHYSKL